MRCVDGRNSIQTTLGLSPHARSRKPFRYGRAALSFRGFSRFRNGGIGVRALEVTLSDCPKTNYCGKHLPKVFPLIKDKGCGLENDRIPS